jgi:DNA-binding SARP family transcriptional activator
VESVEVGKPWGATVRMFGPLQIEWGVQSLEPRSLGGRKPRQVLIHLLLARGKLLTVEELASLLWPQGAPPDCAATLQHYVSVLRRQLRRGGLGLAGLVVTERGGYRADPELMWLDLAAFDAAAKTCSPDGDRDAMSRSLAMYRAEVLDGEPEEPWLLLLRNHYSRAHIRIVLAVAAAALRAGDAADALSLAATAAEREPGSEQAACLLMAARWVTGDVASALSAFDDCERHLAESFGADPLPHTRTMRDAVMQRVSPETVISLALGPGLAGADGAGAGLTGTVITGAGPGHHRPLRWA